METIIKEYETIDGQSLRIEMYYDLGGYSFATHREKKRGYYISVTPVKIEHKEGYTLEYADAFSGASCLLVEVTRKSKVNAEKARKLYFENYKQRLIDYVIDNRDLVA